MTVDFLWLNFLMGVGILLVSMLVAVIISYLMIDAMIPNVDDAQRFKKWTTFGAIAAFILASGSALLTQSGPKVVLTDQSGSVQSGAPGEVQSSAPQRMTDEERLEYNRRLNEENSVRE